MVKHWAPVVIMVLSNVGTGLANVLIKKALDGGISHMVIATYRLAISAFFLAPLALFLERKRRPKLTLSLLCQHFFSALLGASLTQYFCLLGLTSTSATVACAFFSMLPATTFALALLFRSENLNANCKRGIAKVAGTLICIAGALLLTFYKGVTISNPRSQPEALQGNQTHNKTQKWLLGCLFLLVTDVTFSSWMLFQAKINVKYPCKYSSTVLMSLFGTLQCALLSLIKTRDLKAWILKDKFDIIVIVYAGVVGQAMSTAAMTWCIKKRGPVFASAFFPVMLISAALFDIVFLHRRLYLSSIMGSAIIVTGLYVFLWGKHKDLDAVSSELRSPSQIEIPTEIETEKHNETDCDNNPKLSV